MLTRLIKTSGDHLLKIHLLEKKKNVLFFHFWEKKIFI